MDKTSSLRLLIFLTTFFVLLIWEVKKPLGNRRQARSKRWPINLSLILMGQILSRVFLFITPFSLALLYENRGLLAFSGVKSGLVKDLLSYLILDFLIWGQHILFHRYSLLWSLHRVHHLDGDLDLTSGLRFHPLEIFLSLGIKSLAVISLGLSASGVFLFEALLNAGSLFSHSQIEVPPKWDAWLRKVIVTPSMHRIHHSIEAEETLSNFGFTLSIWDYLFKTYKAQAKQGNYSIIFGVKGYENKA